MFREREIYILQHGCYLKTFITSTASYATHTHVNLININNNF